VKKWRNWTFNPTNDEDKEYFLCSAIEQDQKGRLFAWASLLIFIVNQDKRPEIRLAKKHVIYYILA
jgi:hypothetical protein